VWTLVGNGGWTALENGALLVYNGKLVYVSAASGSITLPNTITSIGDWAFSGCSTLTSVSLPAAASIGDWAFSGCDALTSVSLPAAETIGGEAFSGCSALTSVSLPAAASIGQSAFSGCDALTSIILGAIPPTLGSAILEFVSGNIRVRIPLGSENAYGVSSYRNDLIIARVIIPGVGTYDGYPDNWGNRFRGGQRLSSNSDYLIYVNANVYLSFESY
jgi:hypothetical protein